MELFKPMYNYLQEKPQVGIISGLGTGCMLKIQTLLTDEHTLKIVSGLAAWAGCTVALLTAIVWIIKLYDIVIPRIKHKKP